MGKGSASETREGASGHVGTLARGRQVQGASWQGDMVTRDACDAREGTSGQGDMGTRGQGGDSMGLCWRTKGIVY